MPGDFPIPGVIGLTSPSFFPLVFVKVSIQTNMCKAIWKDLKCRELQEGEGVVQGGERYVFCLDGFLCRCVKAKRCKDMVFDSSCVGGAVSIT